MITDWFIIGAKREYLHNPNKTNYSDTAAGMDVVTGPTPSIEWLSRYLHEWEGRELHGLYPTDNQLGQLIDHLRRMCNKLAAALNDPIYHLGAPADHLPPYGNK